MAAIPVQTIRANIQALYDQYISEHPDKTDASMHNILKKMYLEKHGPLFLGNKLDPTIRSFLEKVNSTKPCYVYHKPMVEFDVINRNLKTLYNELLEKGTDVSNPIILRVSLKIAYSSRARLCPTTCPKVSSERLDRILDIFIQDLAYRPAYDQAPSSASKDLLLKHAKLVTKHVEQPIPEAPIVDVEIIGDIMVLEAAEYYSDDE